MLNTILEFLGTMIFLLSILYVTKNKYSTIITSLIVGGTLAFMVFNSASMGGTAHFNPAVSLMMFCNKKIDLNRFLMNILSQFLGGLVALQIPI